MTPDQLKAAAFKYCELKGIDPHRRTHDTTPSQYDVMHLCEEWENVARMLKEHWVRNECLQSSRPT